MGAASSATLTFLVLPEESELAGTEIETRT